MALGYISNNSGGEHPLNSVFLGKTLCGACQRQHGREAQGQKQHLRAERQLSHSHLVKTFSPGCLRLAKKRPSSIGKQIHTPRSSNQHTH